MNCRAITIDNGGSELRYIAGGIQHRMEKNVSKISEDGFRVKDGVEDYEIVRITGLDTQEFDGLYAMGSAYYMYDGTDVIMTSAGRKTTSLAWYQQILLALATDAVKAIKDGKSSVDAEDNTPRDHVDYVMSVLIPVYEHSGAEDAANRCKKRIAGTYEATFMCPHGKTESCTFTLSEERIGVLPEGVVCMAAAGKNLTKNDYTLILDIGHVTADLSVCKGTSLIGNSVISSKYAGGTLLKQISSLIRSNNIVANEEMAIEALTTHKYRMGIHQIDAGSYVDKAKDIYINNYLLNDIMALLDLSGLSASNIQYVIPIGRVLGTKNPETGEYDIIDRIIKLGGFENAEVIRFDDMDTANLKAADKFCQVLLKRG